MSVRSLLNGASRGRAQYGIRGVASSATPATRFTIARAQLEKQPISIIPQPSSFHGAACRACNPTPLSTSTKLSRPSPTDISSLAVRSWRAYATRTLPTQQPSAATTTSPIPRHLYSRARRKTVFQSRSKVSSQASGRSRSSLNKGNGNTPKPATVARPTSQNQSMLGLPQRFHRPTKEELLAAATGFWSRLRALIRAIETLAGWVGNYLTKSSGVKVVFESAIVPKWKDGVITFKNVFVSRRPGHLKADVRKGSQTAAAAAAAELASERATSGDEDTNYTQYDLSIETINVTLSFAKWFNGHGLLRDVEVKGVRGVLDRTSVHWPDEYVDPRTYRHQHNTGDFEIESFKMEDLLISVYQPDNFRPFSVSIFSADLPRLRKQWLFYDFLSANHVSGSFDESLFTIHPRQTHNQTGAQLAEAGSDTIAHWKKQSRIRIDGLNIDHLNRGVQGPFSWIHEGNVDIAADVMFPEDSDESIAKVMSDFYDRVEAQMLHQRGQPAATPTEELKRQVGEELEVEGERVGSNAIVRNRSASVDGGKASATIPHSKSTPISKSLDSSGFSSSSGPSTNSQQQQRQPPPVIFDLSITLTSVHASVPLLTPHLSYINNALIRPIIYYINSHSTAATPLSRKPFIPINCRVVKSVSDFDGAWTVFDSGLMEDISRETYEAFVRGVGERERTRRRVKKVGFWVVQGVVQALVLGLAGQIA